jgi:hypothetical protein
MRLLIVVSLLTQVLAFPRLLRNQEVKESDEPKLPLQRVLQTSLLDEIKVGIGGLIDDNANLAAKFVRLTFHDCVGGCNVSFCLSYMYLIQFYDIPSLENCVFFVLSVLNYISPI